MNYRFTLRSNNRKTGPIPTTMSPQATCPSTCPFKGAGCYAELGPMSLAWKSLDKAGQGVTWEEVLDRIATLPKGQLWRHNTAGDLPHNGGQLDPVKMGELVFANLNKLGFTYTHHVLSAENLKWLKLANEYGFTVNASTESPAGVDTIMEAGFRCGCAAERHSGERPHPRGRRVVVCPAVTHDNVTCESCRLCANPKREVAIGFPAHGGRKLVIDIKLERNHAP